MCITGTKYSLVVALQSKTMSLLEIPITSYDRDELEQMLPLSSAGSHDLDTVYCFRNQGCHLMMHFFFSWRHGRLGNLASAGTDSSVGSGRRLPTPTPGTLQGGPQQQPRWRRALVARRTSFPWRLWGQLGMDTHLPGCSAVCRDGVGTINTEKITCVLVYVCLQSQQLGGWARRLAWL